MKKLIFAEQLIEHVGEEIKELFLLKSIGQRVSLDGKREYIELKFLDRTGEFLGYIFDEYMKTEYYTFRKRVVSLTGQVILRRDAVPKVYVSSMEEAEEYDDFDFYNGLNPEEESLYLEIIRQYTEKITHEGYRAVVKGVYENYMERLVSCPANLVGYNSYNGGILAHTVAVVGVTVYSAKVLSRYCRMQRNLDFDLLVTAALLHEVGKIDEYTTFPLAQRISEGILVSTSELTFRIVYDVMREYNILLTKEDENLLHHLIDVCTENERFIRPMCVEAVIIRQAYQMQTRVEALNFFLKQNEEKTGSIYDSRLENYVYVRNTEEARDEK